MKYLWVWVFIGSSTALGGCSGDDHSPALGPAALPECPNLDYSTCDTREAACQKRLLTLAGCVYGVQTIPDVPVNVVTEAQLLDALSADADAEPPDASDAASLPHIEAALVGLKLLQAGDLTTNGGSTAQLVDSVDGVYQDAERGISLVDRGMPKNSVASDGVLVHEFVHAIQDAEYDLKTWREAQPSDTDNALSLRAIPEGQATWAQYRVVVAMSGSDVDQVDWDRTLDKFRDSVLESVFDDPSPYFASITTFPYALGVERAHAAWVENGLGYHAAQFANPPQTSLEIMAEGYRLAFPTLEPVAFTEPSADADYSSVDASALGAFMLELSAHELGAGTTDALSLALAWRGDKLWIYAGPEQATAWLWEVELAGEQESQSLTKLALSDAKLASESKAARAFLTSRDAPAFVLDAGRAFLAAD